MNRFWPGGLVAAALVISVLPTGGSASRCLTASSRAVDSEVQGREKTWTTGKSENGESSQRVGFQHVASFSKFQAEGTGLEPATPCGAPHFQCGR